jgi:hypothetical protein
MWLHFTFKNIFKCFDTVSDVQYIKLAFGTDLVEGTSFNDISAKTAVIIFTVKVTGNYRGVIINSSSGWSVRGYCLIGNRSTAVHIKYEIFLVVMRKLLKAVTVLFAENSANIGRSGQIPKACSTDYILKYLTL